MPRSASSASTTPANPARPRGPHEAPAPPPPASAAALRRRRAAPAARPRAERLERRAPRGELRPLERCSKAALEFGKQLEPPLDRLEPGRVGLEVGVWPRSVVTDSCSRNPASRSSAETVASAGSNGPRRRQLRGAATNVSAPSPSSGESRSSAPVIAAASSSRWRRRSRSPVIWSRSPGSTAAASARSTRYPARASTLRPPRRPHAPRSTPSRRTQVGPGRSHGGQPLAVRGVAVQQSELRSGFRDPLGLVLR